MWLVQIIVGVVVAFLVGMALRWLFSRNKKSSSQQQTAYTAPPPPPSAARPTHPAQAVFCTNCGTKVEGGSAFCVNCGARIA